MQALRGELQIDDKLFKELFLEHLPTDVQTILASVSEDLSVSKLAEMADRMLEVQRFQPPSIAQLSTSPLLTPNEHLVTQMVAMTAEMASLKLQLAHLTSYRSSSRSPSGRQSHSRPRTAGVCWYHTNFAQRPIGALPPVPSNLHRETSLPENRVGCPGDESVSGLQLADVPLTTGTGTMLSDVSTPFHRPFVPALMRRAVFHTLHGLSHPGI
ncbi:unnamed protein product [Schistocephalus solidus]|uniref:CUE domain-containing protein n=1 Tax=Schistocephalus solidus TaxID=70667 RepID=A0A183TNG3_SCHSO|nr:unnamed protein product [Schistocephalus solidus]